MTQRAQLDLFRTEALLQARQRRCSRLREVEQILVDAERRAEREHRQALVRLGALRILQGGCEEEADKTLVTLAEAFGRDFRSDRPHATESEVNGLTVTYIADVLRLVERIVISGGRQEGTA